MPLAPEPDCCANPTGAKLNAAMVAAKLTAMIDFSMLAISQSPLSDFARASRVNHPFNDKLNHLERQTIEVAPKMRVSYRTVWDRRGSRAATAGIGWCARTVPEGQRDWTIASLRTLSARRLEDSADRV